jgi:hypothetical protein
MPPRKAGQKRVLQARGITKSRIDHHARLWGHRSWLWPPWHHDVPLPACSGHFARCFHLERFWMLCFLLIAFCSNAPDGIIGLAQAWSGRHRITLTCWHKLRYPSYPKNHSTPSSIRMMRSSYPTPQSPIPPHP